MCRIAGIISKQLTPQERLDKVGIMCSLMRHGGPDDEGVFADEKAALVFGHRRLSLIDLTSNGHQPMADVQQKAWITFNGEIYNYLELKAELIKAGAGFKSGTDTEVILQAYLHWGTAAFARLRGMFAFALYDINKSQTYLVRDANGIKPLYYHISGGQLSFSSEVKPLKLAGLATAEDETWQVKLLAFGNIPEPYTTLKNVFSLPKGSFLTWNHQTDSHTISSFAAGNTRHRITTLSEATEAICHIFETAIKRQLISDAPIGVFLSGGIDSSLVTLLAATQQEQNLKTISIFFDEKAYDEQQYQNIVADKIKGEKFFHLVKQTDFDEYLPEVLTAMDMPTTDGINSWFISKYARQDGLKAVLSGIGADELFGGYPSFTRIKYLRYLKALPPSLLKLANYFPGDKYRKASFLANRHHLADYLLLRGLFVPADIAKILGITQKEVNDILFNQISTIELGAYNGVRASWLESNLYMQNQLLRDTDVMSMSHGLEVRVPFLDEDLQQVTESISPDIRFDRKQPKKMLVESFKNILPPQIVNRKKMGFSFPLQEWMKQNNQISGLNFYKNREAKHMVNKFQQGQVHWSKIFALYQIQQNA